MLGTLNTDHKEATIIGAGFAGLVMAWRLSKAGWTIDIYDKADKTGGLIDTRQTLYGLAETAAHSSRVTPSIEAFFKDLNVEMVEAQTSKKYIWRASASADQTDGKCRKIPLTPLEGLGALYRLFFKKGQAHYESLAHWARHHVGDAALDNAIFPMCNGIYAAPPEALSIDAFPKFKPAINQTLFSRLRQIKKSHTASKNGGRAKVMTPKEGMGALIKTLTQKLENTPNVTFHLGENIESLERFADAPNVILTAPAYVAGALIGHEGLAHHPYAPLIAATVFVTKDPKFPDGIGVLHARNSGRHSLGVLYNSSTFPGRTRRDDVASFTVMMGGLSDPDLLNSSDDQIRHMCSQELRDLIGLSSEPLHNEIARWTRAIPVYSPALPRLWRELQDPAHKGWCATKGHVLFGNYTGDVSLRGMIETALNLPLNTDPTLKKGAVPDN